MKKKGKKMTGSDRQKIRVVSESEKPHTEEEQEAISRQEEESELETARKEAAENYDKYVRLSAELENYKKRVARDRADLMNYANEQLIRDLLPIVDSLERALEHASNSGDFEAFKAGLKLIDEQLHGTLEKHGVEKIEAVGADFDPSIHEAVMQVESSEHDANQVVEEFETGYLLNGRLLRPTKVSVAK
ncbi:MAG: nucleotide exchange factor GrpE [Deltaproteobacteria bacterium]|nr:nucleotide exchange factor GrpE [Deltaproteobacteria bacterium]